MVAGTENKNVGIRARKKKEKGMKKDIVTHVTLILEKVVHVAC